MVEENSMVEEDLTDEVNTRTIQEEGIDVGSITMVNILVQNVLSRTKFT